MQSAPVVRFGIFELDLRAGELRKRGLKIKLQGQPLQILVMLLEQPGQVITREQLHEKLWSDGTLVDFEHGLNAAIQRLRQALGDSAENPRFVETLARRGYRFLAPVDGAVNGAAEPTTLPQHVILDIPGTTQRVAEDRQKPRRLWLILPFALFVAVSLGLGVLAVIYFRHRPTEGHTLRFQVPPPDNVTFDSADSLVISPNGRSLVFTGRGSDGRRHLWLHHLDSLTAQLLPGTEISYFPFWSPDSRFVGFFALGTSKPEIKKIDVMTGLIQTVCGSTFSPGGGTWNRDDIILFSQTNGLHRKDLAPNTLYRVPAAGGEAKPVLQLDSSRNEQSQITPQFLPDGRHFLYHSISGNPGAEKQALYVGSLDAKQTRLLTPTDSEAHYVPPDFLMYERQRTLFIQPLDIKNLRLSGEPLPVAGPFEHNPYDSLIFSASDNGVLVYRSEVSGNVQLAWYSRNGKRLASIGDPGAFEVISMSPDETRLAMQGLDLQTGKHAIWTMELSSGNLTRQTFHPADNEHPVWSPNGRELIFRSDRSGNFDLYRKVVNGAAEELLSASNEPEVAHQWLRDGSILVTSRGTHTTDTSRLLLSGKRRMVLLLKTAFPGINWFKVSPDECSVAYESNESGEWEIYVSAFPTFTEKRRVSNSGGFQALWRRDGKELFYFTRDGTLMSIDVRPGKGIETGSPRVLCRMPGRPVPGWDQYSVTGDGKRFIFFEPVKELRSFTVVMNWNAGPKQ